jgi:hypothetical protein
MDRVNEVTTVEAANAPLFLAFNRRFDPSVLEMKARILAGDIGELELVTVISKDPGGGLPISYLKTSGGMFRDMTINDFGMARHIMGEDFVTVSAEASALTDPAIAGIGDIDTAVVTMRTASGKIAVITNSRRASIGYDQRVEARGALGHATNRERARQHDGARNGRWCPSIQALVLLRCRSRLFSKPVVEITDVRRACLSHCRSARPFSSRIRLTTLAHSWRAASAAHHAQKSGKKDRMDAMCEIRSTRPNTVMDCWAGILYSLWPEEIGHGTPPRCH